MTEFVPEEKVENKFGMAMSITGDYERSYNSPAPPSTVASDGMPNAVELEVPDGAPPPPIAGDFEMMLLDCSASMSAGYGDMCMSCCGMEMGPGLPIKDMNIQLTAQEDLYIQDGLLDSVSSDNTKTIDDINTEVKSGIRDDVFKIEVDKSLLRDGAEDMNALDTSLDLNGHSIYSDSHLMIGMEVTGEGSLVSSKKLAYLTGSGDPDIAALSNDDFTGGIYRGSRRIQCKWCSLFQ